MLLSSPLSYDIRIHADDLEKGYDLQVEIHIDLVERGNMYLQIDHYHNKAAQDSIQNQTWAQTYCE